ncbi:MAG: transposase [Verrucomicrobiales bacterium]|nr:transposase [Verrucomicrobiales bacterium]
MPFLPTDLAEELGAVRLTQLALESVLEEDVASGEFRAGPGLQCHQHRMLLTLMSYAYARGVFGSEEIQERVRTDGDLRYLCAREFPEAESLRLFRRREWARLNRTLIRLLERFVRIRRPDWPGDVALEAVARMERAAAADSLALDY